MAMIDGARIEALMQAHCMTQAELARRVGVAQPTIYKLLRDNKTGTKHLHKVARELHTTPAYLMGETDDPNSELPDDTFSSEEREWVELLRSMPVKDRSAALQLIRTIAHSALTPTIQANQHEYKAG